MRVPCTNSPFSLGVHNVRPLFSIGTTAQGFTFLLHPVIRKYMTILHNFTKLIDMRFSLFTCKADRKRLFFCGEERHEQKQHEQRDSSRGNFYAKPPPLEVQICRLAVFRGKRSGRQEMQLAQFQSKRWPKQARRRELTWTVIREQTGHRREIVIVTLLYLALWCFMPLKGHSNWTHLMQKF